MNPVYRSYPSGTTGAQTPVIVDYAVAPFTMNVGCYVVADTLSYEVDFTLDDPNLEDPNDPAVRWFPDPNIPASTSTSKVSAYSAPVRAIRVNITTNSGGLELKIIQGYSIT